MDHMLGQLATMRFSGPLLAALVLLSQRAAIIFCALWPLRSSLPLVQIWWVGNFRVKVFPGLCFLALQVLIFSGNTILLIIRKLSVSLHSVIPRAINQTRDLTGSYNS